jgi:ribosomal protein S18 acetylase RimI-like enzyme
MTFTIEECKLEDVPSLSVFMEKAFCDTFPNLYSPEDLDEFLTKTYNPSIQAMEIQENDRITLLIKRDSVLAGYAMLLLDSTEPGISGPERKAQIQRFYIDKPFHGCGAAHNLMREIFSRGVDLGVKTFWLGVWENNHRAQRFYQKYGFEHVGEHVFAVGKNLDRDLLYQTIIKKLNNSG